MKVTFIGAGVFGRALASLAEGNGHQVQFYDPIKFPENSLKFALQGAEAVVYVAPSSAAAEILPQLPADLPLICASKGFLSLAPFTRFTNFSALGGAAFAEDIMEATPRLGSKIILTASAPLSEHLFSADFLYVEYTPDTRGILLCGALKNVYAIGAGMEMAGQGSTPVDASSTPVSERHTPVDADSTPVTDASTPVSEASAVAGSDTPPLQAYLKKAFHELEDILFDNGASPDTAQLSCGLPDLLISCTENSRNFRYGQGIAAQAVPVGPVSTPVDADSTPVTASSTPVSEASAVAGSDTTIEGLSVIKSIAATPDFIIPSTATLLKSIITKINPEEAKNATN